jgi:hypothetical protein
MKKASLVLSLLLLSFASFSQFVARAQIKENVEGICDKKNVYALMGMLKGQKEAVCAVKKPMIEQMLNDSVQFIKDSINYADKGMVSIIINFKGKVVQCKTDNKTKSPLLDEQIVNVFKKLTSWEAGQLDGEDVDSIRLWSFEIKNGKLKLN